MSQKVFYRYNSATEQYERVYPDRRRRLMASARVYAWSVLTVAVVALGLYYIIESPREKMLRERNEQLMQRLELLGRQADEALAVMEDVAERDNNFYRVMMQAEPLNPARRYAGLERQRNYDRIDSMADNRLLREVSMKLDRLDRMLVSQIKSFDFLAAEASGQKDRMAHIPAIQPVPEKFLRTMASGYGTRVDPIYGTAKFHEGMDFSAPPGTPVYATADGTVLSADWNSGYGNLIEINHGYNYVTRYAHLSKMIATKGQKVKRGDLIGLVGNTGKSTGPHLHYEVRYRGAPQNPVNYYFYDLSPEQYDEIIRLAENAGHVMD
ncbi:MAG: M23 family metallopeptidase [Muribaculaceae bacterium]|nr:M23 family metallopeptidase [Muribaculaceae bacterium]